MQLQYDIDKKAIGERLRSVRVNKGLTQEQLSEEIGVTSKYLSKVENGAAAPSLQFILRFSEVTGSDPGFLLKGPDSGKGGAGSSFSESGGGYEEASGRTAGKRSGRTAAGMKICEEITEKIMDVLEKNGIL